MCHILASEDARLNSRSFGIVMVAAGKGSDLNPDFSFDFGTVAVPAQAPWEMSGAQAFIKLDMLCDV